MQPEEIAQVVGKTTAVRVYEVEKGAIRRYAGAVGDPNPLYRDDEYARKTRFGGIIAPPGFFGWPLAMPMNAPLQTEFPADAIEVIGMSGYFLPSALDGGMEYDLCAPVRPGDTLAATTTVKEVRERPGRAGKLCFIVLETTYVNQTGALVAKARATVILRSFSL